MVGKKEMNAFKMKKIQNWFFGKSAYKEFSIISSIFRVFYFFVESACPISPPHPGFHPSSWQSSFTFISCVICSSLSATASHCTLLVSFLGFQHLPKISSIFLCTHTLKPRIHIWKDMRDFFSEFRVTSYIIFSKSTYLSQSFIFSA